MNKKTFLALSFFFYHLCLPYLEILATDNDAPDPPKYLSRYCSDSDDEENQEHECCRYHSKDRSISFKKDPVYSPEYDNINNEIKKQLDFLMGPTDRTGYKVTFLTVILSATGTNDKGDIERVYDHLYIKEENGEPIFLTSKRKGARVLVFSSDNQNYGAGYNIAKFKKQFNFFSPDSDHNLFNLSSFSDKSPTRSIFNKVYASHSQCSHAEPLCLSAIQTLSKDTFQRFLPGYNLNYYEIHLISNFDACGGCPKIVYREMEILKEKFGHNLFMFFHSNLPYTKKNYQPLVYRVKFEHPENNWQTISVSFNYQKYDLKIQSFNNSDDEKRKALLSHKNKTLDIRRNRNLETVPLYYFALIHELEGKTVNIIVSDNNL